MVIKNNYFTSQLGVSTPDMYQKDSNMLRNYVNITTVLLHYLKLLRQSR